MDEPKEKSDKEILLRKIISERYEPADSVKDSDICLTTQQICSSLKKVLPFSWVDQEIVYNILQELNFKYDAVKNPTDLQWLIKTKKN